MNFCVAILILKMEENTWHFQYIMLYYFKKCENTTEMQKKKICAVYGEGAVTDQMCQKWFAKFSVRALSLNDFPRSGRWVEVDSDQIKTLIENNQNYTTQEIADILKISKSIKLLVKKKNVSFILQKKQTNLLANPTVSPSSEGLTGHGSLKSVEEWTTGGEHPCPG